MGSVQKGQNEPMLDSSHEDWTSINIVVILQNSKSVEKIPNSTEKSPTWE